MAVYLNIHFAPGISEEEMTTYAPEVAASVHATFKQMYANTESGHIYTVYEADSADQVKQEFERIGFPFDAIHEIDVMFDAAAVAALASQ